MFTGRKLRTIITLPDRDPVTHDPLSRAEAMSWLAQSIIRRWRFIIGYTLVTFTVWAVGSPPVLGWWNYTASWLALVIESVVGIGVYNMSRRDAVILREVRAETQRVEAAAARIERVAEMVLDGQLRGER